jgi:hypothetical protein
MDSDTPSTVAPYAPSTTVKAASPFKLTVKFAFADYQVGEQITDAAEVAAVLEGENAANVLKTAA